VGNLGPASVVTSREVPGEWLTDRWQAAANMAGEPLPGEHWVEIDLEKASHVEAVEVLWEKALARRWTAEARLSEDKPWLALAVGEKAEERVLDETHIRHWVQASGEGAARARFIRILIHEPATQWGSSIWRVRVWGRHV